MVSQAFDFNLRLIEVFVIKIHWSHLEQGAIKSDSLEGRPVVLINLCPELLNGDAVVQLWVELILAELDEEVTQELSVDFFLTPLNIPPSGILIRKRLNVDLVHERRNLAQRAVHLLAVRLLQTI